MEPGSKTLSYYNVPLVTSTDKAFMPAGKKEKKLKDPDPEQAKRENLEFESVHR